MSDDSPLDAWFLYAIRLSEMVYTMKLELYEFSCERFIEEAVAAAAAKAACDPSTASASQPPGSVGEGVGGNHPPEIHDDNTAATAAAAAAMKVHDEWLAVSCMTRPPAMRKRAEECLDAVEAEKEAVYYELGEGYAVTAEDEAAMQASRLARWHLQGVRTSLPPNGEHQDSCADRDLLYGELTSLGVRQLHALASKLISEAREHMYGLAAEVDVAEGDGVTVDDRPADPGFIMEAVDVGCGTGKVLFEWARLAAMEYRQRPPLPRRWANGTSQATTPTAQEGARWQGAPSLVESCTSSAAQTPTLPHHGGYPLPWPHATNSREGSVRAPGADEAWEGQDHLPRHEEPLMKTDLVGWLGVGLELAPSRAAIARGALAPNYLDLVPETATPGPCGIAREAAMGSVLLSDAAEAACRAKGCQEDATEAEGSAQPPRYTPVPPRAVLVVPKCSPVPVARQPAGCVLLYEGDALTSGVLTNETLFRYPATPVVSQTATSSESPHRVPGKENYFKLCRGMPRRGRLSGSEDVHIVVFCSGLGFDGGFVRLLCQRLEELLPGHPNNKSSGECGDGAPAAKGSWKSVTCVLLLRGDINVRDADLPLFRCVQDWRQDPQEKRDAPSWCTVAGGLQASLATVEHLDTTWMSRAPAWVVHFRY